MISLADPVFLVARFLVDVFIQVHLLMCSCFFFLLIFFRVGALIYLISMPFGSLGAV